MERKKNGRGDVSLNNSMEDEAFPPLPPPLSPGEGGLEGGEASGNEADEEGNVSKLAEVPAAKRKGVKRPQPKLDSHRLISERGLPALRTLFDDVHFKGKGHEASDLRLLMQKMENWAHRLFPKLQFEDFIDKVEKLGAKKDVQTCLKRIRLDMPLTHDDFMNPNGEEAAAEPQIFGDPDPFNGSGFLRDAPVFSTPAPSVPLPPPPVVSPAPPSLTEEQQRRMELNRQRALEKRLARHNRQTSQETDSQEVNASADESVSAANITNTSDQQGGDSEEQEDLQMAPAEISKRPTCKTLPTNS